MSGSSQEPEEATPANLQKGAGPAEIPSPLAGEGGPKGRKGGIISSLILRIRTLSLPWRIFWMLLLSLLGAGIATAISYGY